MLSKECLKLRRRINFADTVVGDFWYLRFFAKLMRGGRFYEVVRVQKTLGLLLKRLTLLPKLVVYRAILKLRPIVGVKWRKKKKKGKKREYFQIPCFISFDSSMRLGIKWFFMGLAEVKNTLGVRKVSQGVLLYEELLKYLKKQETGGGLLKRALYRSAVKHRAAVRFRW